MMMSISRIQMKANRCVYECTIVVLRLLCCSGLHRFPFNRIFNTAPVIHLFLVFLLALCSPHILTSFSIYIFCISYSREKKMVYVDKLVHYGTSFFSHNEF